MSLVVKCVAAIHCYERKAELGGGFRARYRNSETKETVDEVFDTMAAARFWAKTQVHTRHAAEGYRFGYYRNKSGGEYHANVFCNRQTESGRVGYTE